MDLELITLEYWLEIEENKTALHGYDISRFFLDAQQVPSYDLNLTLEG